MRKAASGDNVVITDRGRPVATLSALDETDLGTKFSHRRTLPEFEALPDIAGDSSTYVTEDRSRE